jgi:hypothetical protein
MTVGGIWIHRLENGRIVEGRDWGLVDWLGFYRQIGVELHRPEYPLC